MRLRGLEVFVIDGFEPGLSCRQRGGGSFGCVWPTTSGKNKSCSNDETEYGTAPTPEVGTPVGEFPWQFEHCGLMLRVEFDLAKMGVQEQLDRLNK